MINSTTEKIKLLIYKLFPFHVLSYSEVFHGLWIILPPLPETKSQMHALRKHCIVIFKGIEAVWLFKGWEKTLEIRLFFTVPRELRKVTNETKGDNSVGFKKNKKGKVL